MLMEDYNEAVAGFRETEYPMLKDAVYLDHAGTTLYSKSLMESFMADMMSNLYGNPHSASASSQLATARIDDTRLKVLRFLQADPDEFDIVFVQNATAGVKLVMDALRDCEGGFTYGYHQSSHTSLVGVRENAISSQCLTDADVEKWLNGPADEAAGLHLFAYPAQSNLEGRRFPRSWIEAARKMSRATRQIYTLLDASAFVSTAPLDLSNRTTAADFTVLSFYKIFGFPDLGALVVRKDAGKILGQRKYFGGGTVDTVVCNRERWHALKTQSLHDSLEDGSLPIHNIMALDSAIDVHKQLYGSMNRISRHTMSLAQRLYHGLKNQKHANLEPVCEIYSRGFELENTTSIQGPIVAFNVKSSRGFWHSNIEFERLASIRNFHLRSGGLCNPGGIASSLNLEPWEIRRNHSAGLRCGGETDIYSGKITGVIRVSLGAMSTTEDVDRFVTFVDEFFAEKEPLQVLAETPFSKAADHFVESLTIYPIKSCGGFDIPPNTPWEVRPEGLAWDREWFLIHQGTGQALNQKRYPRMALIKPRIDFLNGLLRIGYQGSKSTSPTEEVIVPLSSNPLLLKPLHENKPHPSRVCGELIVARHYASQEVNDFFSRILQVPCTLARFPAGGSGSSTRHSKAHMQKHQRPAGGLISTMKPSNPPSSWTSPMTPPDSDTETQKRPILLSNESPILVIYRTSLSALNQAILLSGGKQAEATVFRANIVVASNLHNAAAYSEDHWTKLRIGQEAFQMLGSCRRCHMICIDQTTAEKDEEPFVTLSKTRKFQGKVWFGGHMCHVPDEGLARPTISVGDLVSIE